MTDLFPDIGAKEVALVVMDKDTYIEKCMTLLNDHNLYQECRDLTKTSHNMVIKQLTNLKINLGLEFKNMYPKLYPTGDNSPPARFYGLL